MPHLPYGPPNVRLIRPSRLPQALLDAGVALVEQKLSNSTVKDLVSISDHEWQIACRRFNATQRLSQHHGRLQARVDSIAKMFGVTERTVRRWLSIYRRNPDIVALLPKSRGQAVGTRRLAPNIERLLNDVIDTWAAKAERYGWINRAIPDQEFEAFIEQFARRVASFDSQSIREAKRLVTLHGGGSTLADYDASAATFYGKQPWPGTAARFPKLLEPGSGKQSDLELNFGRRLGELWSEN